MTEYEPNSYTKIIAYYKKELELKKREISELQMEIIKNKNENRSLMNKIDQLMYQNYKVKELYETQIEAKNKKQNLIQSDLGNQINELNQQVSDIKHKTQLSFNCNCKEKVFDNSQLQMSLNELEVINYKNTQLIERMQMFYNHINKLFNKHNRIKLNYENDSFEQFQFGLMAIENGVYDQYSNKSNKENKKQTLIFV